MKNLNGLLGMLALALYGCITPLEYDAQISVDVLVVEGHIDTDYGPHEVQISYLAKYAGVLDGGFKELPDSRVQLFDDVGNVVDLTSEIIIREEFDCSGAGAFEVRTNYFTSPAFRGIEGRSYWLEIEVEESGKVYRSLMQTMPEIVPIDSLILQYDEKAGEEEDRTGVDVYAVFSDPPSQDNFYHWEVGGIYRIQTPPIPNQECCVYRGNDGDDCWVVEKNITEKFVTKSDQAEGGGVIVERVGFIEDDTKRFASTWVPNEKQYYVSVEQYTLSREAYEFQVSMGVINEVNGEIFDPAPIEIKGNIYSISDAKETVVGFFGVYGKHTKGIFIHRDLLQEVKQHSICGDCRFGNIDGQIEIPEVYR